MERELEKELMKIQSMLEDLFDNSLEWRLCPLCGYRTRVFDPRGHVLRPNAECPKCKSLERHRALWLWINNGGIELKEGMKILHFAPEFSIYSKLNKQYKDTYFPVDINPKHKYARHVVDITDITFEDDTFDLIICNHILEHIADLKSALSELRRVLNKTGIALLNVPIYTQYEHTLEKDEYNTPELRLKYYGQEDHVRAFGKDYPEILMQAGFDVTEIRIKDVFSKQEIYKYGLKGSEKIFICKKGFVKSFDIK